MRNTIKNAIVMLLTLATTAHASLSIQSGETGFLMWVFVAFVGLIITFQLVPGLTLFAGMIKELIAGQGKAY